MTPRRDPQRSKSQSAVNEERSCLVFRNHPTPACVYDLETLALIEVNDAAIEKYGYAREEFLEMTLKDIFPPEDLTRLFDRMAKLRSEQLLSDEWRRSLRNDSIIDAEIFSHTLIYHGRKVALMIDQDTTEQMDAAEVIHASDKRHRSLFENMLEGFSYCRMLFENDRPVDYEYLEVNKAFEEVLGLKDVIGKGATKVIPGINESNPELLELCGRVAQTGQPEQCEIYINPLDTWFSISVYSMQQGYFAAIYSDITERKRAEDHVTRLNRLYAILSNVNQEIVRIHDQHQLLERACRIAVDFGEFKMAWIGMVHPGTQKIDVVAMKGATDGYLDKITVDLNDDLQNGGPTGSAIQMGMNTILNDIEHDSIMRPWLESALRLGCRSSASFVLKASGDICGVFSLYAPEVGYFANDEIRLLNQLAKDISFAIEFNQQESERKRAQEALAESERRFHQLFDEAPVGYHEIDIHGCIVEVNRTELEMLCYSAEEMLHHPAWEFLVEGESARQAIGADIAGPMQSDQTYECAFRRKDGKALDVMIKHRVLRNEAGEVVGIRSTVQDITKRKEAEEHLRQSEEQFRLIAENVGDMITMLDLDGRRIYSSPSYTGILGDPEPLKGTDAFREVHPDDVAKVKQVFQETVRTGIAHRIEYRLFGKDGSVRDIDSKGSVIRDNDGKIFRIIAVSRDVTEEKRLAAQFLRAQRMESIGTLAGGIAHDLNNVLAPIIMATEILKDIIPNPRGKNILNTIETSAKRGADIVKQVLAFGRGVKGDRIIVQLKHIVNEAAGIAVQTFPKSIKIKTAIPLDLWPVSADPTQMHQVLLNMMVNARDAMPKGGNLTISAENIHLDDNYSRMQLGAKPGPHVSLSIIDTGTGIPSDIREKIFEPFFTTKEIGEGTGLGLSTTLAIVRSHGGFINLDSELGKGTAFHIYIPSTETASGETALSEEANLPMGNGELILVIDDEAAIREITKETLETYGYKVLSASDGAEGVAVFAESKKEIKVVITDILMPIMDGTAAILVMQKIRPDVKVIATSAMTTEGQISTLAKSNVLAFLTKPYTAEKLLKALAAALTMNSSAIFLVSLTTPFI